MLLHAGETWVVEGRKGRLSIKLLEEVDTDLDAFFQARLVEGVPVYISRGVDPEEPGDEMTFRISITQFVQKVE
jgi:hypothetical protein